MSQPAISVKGLSKEYVVGQAQQRHGTFYDLLAHSIKAPFKRLGKLGGHNEEADKFWALKDISFDIQPGEVVGVIGRNGAGKSTLLKILSRITAPTKGEIVIRGRLASLLEVGTGFHPELSGRENIYLNGAILGMTRKEVASKFDEIVAFAEIEKFIDTPVKRYSSGMYVRLAFAVAAHLDVDVLLVDEVLAVGDATFQRKSLGRMSEVASGGKTVVFVSHNLAAVRNLCKKAFVFEHGMLGFSGDVAGGVDHYEKSVVRQVGLLGEALFTGSLAKTVRFDKLICKQNGKVVELIDPINPLQIEIEGYSQQSFPFLLLKLAIFRDGFHIMSWLDTELDSSMQQGAFVSRFELPADSFRPGRYTIGIGVSASIGEWSWGADVAVLDFIQNIGGRAIERIDGVVSIPYTSQRIQ